jgi:RimJ/RimL family protein N-acetyltransferase
MPWLAFCAPDPKRWGAKMASVTLRPFQSEDLQKQRTWAEAINARSYMSRIFPKRFDGYEVDNQDYFCWFVIVCDNADVGSVWLEKENKDDNFVQLGIIIGHERLFSKGIGRKAIVQAIQESKSTFHLQIIRLNVRKNNIRAQACYSACGFRVIFQGVKTNDLGEKIEFLTMEKSIPNK